MKKPIIALDFSTKKEAVQFLDIFEGESLYVKVGMELFYQTGAEIIEIIKERDHQLFLDLKLHDIPNTVKKAMKGLAGLGVDMLNVHAAGGREMMEAAMEGLAAGTPSGGVVPKLIAVTQLTSTSEKQMQSEQLIPATLDESVIHYAKLAHCAGLDGVVCSAFEAEKIKKATNESFICVTPGIRLKGMNAQDQKRVMTPLGARMHGSSAIVAGRAVTASKHPLNTYRMIANEWEAVYS
ncbi:orotidine-5'-phosphate decarboxylase [Falsibacillus pallidus]|uniref:orotidine-5'-phosphate decarboxylase n=1 Tax=Falsibacillus pallidus TaxID=493781 RepID=UPI002482B252|nr:orotidine-5'-phosphate decarboxylase [Falsibacillus pallidus]